MLEERIGPDLCLPELLYQEPVNGPRRIQGFHGLVTVDSTWKPERELVEARLFYSAGVLILAAGDRGTRWAVWNEGADRPAWCPEGRSAGMPLLDRLSSSILLWQVTDNRGLGGAYVKREEAGQARLKAWTYYEQDVLRWWRIGTDG
jgi:hypothetical protein